MNDERLMAAVSEEHDSYDQDRENVLMTAMHDFYNRRMRWVIVITWGWGLAMIAVAVYCGIRFFQVDTVRDQILLAAIFLLSMQWLAIVKVFAWLMIVRNGLLREIKQLEHRLTARMPG
jgi:hypothetical protein